MGMTDKEYRPAHAEDPAATLSSEEFNLLMRKLLCRSQPDDAGASTDGDETPVPCDVPSA